MDHQVIIIVENEVNNNNIKDPNGFEMIFS